MKKLIHALACLLGSGLLYSQSLPGYVAGKTVVGYDYGVGGTLLWDKRSFDEKERKGMIFNIFLEAKQKKISYSLLLNWTGEVSILGGEKDESQTSIALLAGKDFFRKNSFISFSTGPSYTWASYRKYVQIITPAYNYYGTVMAKDSYIGLVCVAKGGTGTRIGRFYPYLALSLLGNVSKKGSYAGITGGTGIKVHLGKRSAKNE